MKNIRQLIAGKVPVTILLALGGFAVGGLGWYVVTKDSGAAATADVPAVVPATKAIPPVEGKHGASSNSKAGTSSTDLPVAAEPIVEENPDLEEVLRLLENPDMPAQEFLDSKPMQRWAKRDPRGLMEWLGKNKVPITGGGGPGGLKVAIYEWSKNDMNACAEWFKANSNYTHYDHGIRYFVEFLAPVDLDAAIAWHGTIKDPIMRIKSSVLLEKYIPKVPAPSSLARPEPTTN